jgi:hypothetical protein
MLVRDGHCAQCGIHVDNTRLEGFRMGTPCPDPACPSHNRDAWLAWYNEHDDLDFNFGPVDWVKLRAWVEPFKNHIRAAHSLPPVDASVLRIPRSAG